jgi:hypothetical protein
MYIGRVVSDVSKALMSFETSETTRPKTGCNIPQNINLQHHRCENLQSYIRFSISGVPNDHGIILSRIVLSSVPVLNFKTVCDTNSPLFWKPGRSCFDFVVSLLLYLNFLLSFCLYLWQEMHFTSVLHSCLTTELQNRKVGSIRKGKTDGRRGTEVVLTACIKKGVFITKNN